MEELKLEARKLERRETKGVIPCVGCYPDLPCNETCAAIDVGYYTFSALKSIKETVMGFLVYIAEYIFGICF
jgi:hypothetical protein